jgi:type VI secretion system protein
MSAERSLLERLSRPRDEGRRAVADVAQLRRSVLLSLQHLFNTRTGHASAQPDLGMPSPSDITGASPNAVALVLKNLRSCIEKYEPRLRDVEISHVEGVEEVLTLRFQVTARLETAPDGSSISFDTVVDPGGHVRVQA